MSETRDAARRTPFTRYQKRVKAILPILALALILWRLPETANRELEETSRL